MEVLVAPSTNIEKPCPSKYEITHLKSPEMAMIELVDFNELLTKDQSTKKKSRRRGGKKSSSATTKVSSIISSKRERNITHSSWQRTIIPFNKVFICI
ncbi:hypothetical protein N9K77_01185 [bacterium]|nr:hypothetical protein [bacterium]